MASAAGGTKTENREGSVEEEKKQQCRAEGTGTEGGRMKTGFISLHDQPPSGREGTHSHGTDSKQPIH